MTTENAATSTSTALARYDAELRRLRATDVDQLPIGAHFTPILVALRVVPGS